MTGEPTTRRDGLAAWARLHAGADATVENVEPLSGHGGETVGLTLRSPALASPRALVARFAPYGVARRANTDVLRQAPLLRALDIAGMPVAPVVAEVTREGPFGTDVLVQERLTGRPLSLFPPVSGRATPVADHLRRATEALARLHALDHTSLLPDWDVAQSPRDVVERWALLVPKQPEPAWAEQAARLAEELLRTCPDSAPTGVCHGDYQTNNVLFDDDGTLVGIIDWELAHVGPTPLDVAWLAMMTDPTCWGEPHRSRLLVTAAPGAVLGWYADAGGRLPEPEWYLALACFRFGVICGHNVRLHRTGRRVDDFNGELAGTVPVLLDRGLAILRA